VTFVTGRALARVRKWLQRRFSRRHDPQENVAKVR